MLSANILHPFSRNHQETEAAKYLPAVIECLQGACSLKKLLALVAIPVILIASPLSASAAKTTAVFDGSYSVTEHAISTVTCDGVAPVSTSATTNSRFNVAGGHIDGHPIHFTFANDQSGAAEIAIRAGELTLDVKLTFRLVSRGGSWVLGTGRANGEIGGCKDTSFESLRGSRSG
jgi:hypothetical protein